MIMVLLGGFAFAQEGETAAPAETAEVAAPAPAPAPVAADKAKEADHAAMADKAVGLKASISGSAKVTWGINLNKDADGRYPNGFKNDASIKIEIPFFWWQKDGFTGEAPVYAEIAGKVKNVDGKIESTAGSIGVAKLHFYGAYISVVKPGFGAGEAVMFKSITGKKNGLFDPEFAGNGLAIGYATDMMGLDVALKLASNGSWEDKAVPGKKEVSYAPAKFAGKKVTAAEIAKKYYVKSAVTGDKDAKGVVYVSAPALMPGADAPADYFVKEEKVVGAKGAKYGHYAMGIDFAMTPVEKYLSINATVNMAFKAAEFAQAGKGVYTNFGLGLSSKPVDGLSLGLGFDGEYGAKFAYDFGFKVAYNWVDMAMYFVNTPKLDKQFNMHFGFNSLDLVKNLSAKAAFNMYDLMNIKNYKTLPMGVGLDLSYTYEITDAMSITPIAGMKMETNHGAKKNFAMAYNLGLEFVPVSHATVFMYWDHGSYNEEKYSGAYSGDNMIGTSVLDKANDKLFTMGLKIKF